MAYLARRVAAATGVAVALSVVCFALLDLAPGNPAAAILRARSGGRPPDPEDVQALAERMGLHDPLLARYLDWASGALTGDFGTSYATGLPVGAVLTSTIGWTLLLTAAATALSIVGALALGSVAALTRWGWLRATIRNAMFVLGGMPGFVTALLLLFAFSAQTGLLPSGGVTRPGEPATATGTAAHLVLPAVALAFGHHFGVYVRLVESGVGRLVDAPHVQHARVRGVSEGGIALRHLLRPGLGPFVARLGVGTGGLLSGAYATEVIFSWPGMGRAAVEAARAQDYPVLVAVVLVTGVLVVAANLLAELGVAALDPRIRHEPGSESRP